MSSPLADRIRPNTLDDVVGQKHLLGEGKPLRRIIESGTIPNLIFYGPSGVGKTTVASIIAKQSNKRLYKLNATTASTADIREMLSSAEMLGGENGILLYLDEIQYFNRKQQQSLLEYIEDGRITLIASTTENPHFYVYDALISRSSLFEFRPVSPQSCVSALRRALNFLNDEEAKENSESKPVTATDEILLRVSKMANGDVRRSIGLLESAYYTCDGEITEEELKNLDSGFGEYSDDDHFDLLSCLQKSIRGSDPDATAFYVAKLCEAGELISLCRRLQVIASEDIGLAYPQAAVVTRACCESAKELGFPEARIPLINAAILLATSPKSNSAYTALAIAAEDIHAGKGQEIPVHLRAPLYKGYKYPHDYPNHYVKQQYLPSDIKDNIYYLYGQNKTEQAAHAYAESISSAKYKKS